MDVTVIIFSAPLCISIASGVLMVQNIRLAHLSVRKSELWLIGSGCRLGWWEGSVEGWVY